MQRRRQVGRDELAKMGRGRFVFTRLYFEKEEKRRDSQGL